MKQLGYQAGIAALLALAACGKKSDSNTAQPGSNSGSNAAPANGTTTPPPAGTPVTAGGLLHKSSTSTLYISAEPNYFTFVELQKGSVAVGTTIDAVDSAGHRMSFVVKSIKRSEPNPDTGTDREVEAKVLKAGEEGNIDLTLTAGKMSDFGGEFYFVDAGATLPADVAAAAVAAKAADDVRNGKIECKLDGKPWPVMMGEMLFYKKGMLKTDKPYLMLPFFASTKPDNRNVTTSVNGFAAKPGQVDMKVIETLMTGAADGNSKDNGVFLGYKNMPDYKEASVNLTFTRWEEKDAASAMADFTFVAKLTGVLMKKQTAANIDCTVKDAKVRMYEKGQYEK